MAKLISCLIFCALLGTPSAQATSFVERPFSESVQDAPIIVHGKIGMSYANWVQGTDGGKRIYTFTELKIDEVIKGGVSGSTLTFREIGGEKDGTGMQVAGSAQFQKGEEVVIFLNPPNSDGSLDLRGLMMGKYNVERNAQGEEILTGAGLSGRAHDDSDDLGGAHFEKEAAQNDTSHARKWTLNDLRKLVAFQKGERAAPDSVKNSSPLPVVKPSVAATQPPTEVMTSSPAAPAPQLQSPTLELASTRWDLIGAGFAVAGGAAFYFFRRRRNLKD